MTSMMTSLSAGYLSDAAHKVMGMTSWWLLADEPRYSQMGARFRDNSGSNQLVQLFWLVVPCLLAILAIWLAQRLIERRKTLRRTSPRFLFHELCKTHQLSRADQKRLWRHALGLKLEHPAAVFVVAESFSENALEEIDVTQQTELRAIATRLFGDQVLDSNSG